MRLPKPVSDLLGGPLWGAAGTRSHELVPAYHLTWGVRVAAANPAAEVEALVPAPFTAFLRENLAENGRIALTVTDVMTHETYQLKGCATEVREPTVEELRFQKDWARAHVTNLRKALPEHLCARLDHVVDAPPTYVRFRVEEVYVQTPGPTAGRSLPLED